MFSSNTLTPVEIYELSQGSNGNDGNTYSVYNAHYAQVKFTNSMAVSTFKLTPRSGGGGGGGEPIDFRILSSHDAVKWNAAVTVNDGEIADNWPTNEIAWSTQEYTNDLSDNTYTHGTYWRLAVKKISTGDKAQLSKMELLGGLASTLGQRGVGVLKPLSTFGPSGVVINSTNTADVFSTAFPGNATTGPEPEINKWSWVGSSNSDSLSLETTDEQNVNTIDLHVWKVTITL